MQNFYTTSQLLRNVALSCALNGIGVAMFTLVILAWNNCTHAPGSAEQNRGQLVAPQDLGRATVVPASRA